MGYYGVPTHAREGIEMGRPSKFTADRRAAILKNLETGVSREVASRASGVDPETLRRWIRKGEDAAKGLYHQFATDVIKAESVAVVDMVQVIHDASQRGDWRAAAWWLERRRPADWGRRQAREQVGQGNTSIKVEYVEKPPVEHVVNWKTKPILNPDALNPVS